MLDTLYSATLGIAVALTVLAIGAELWHRNTRSAAASRLGAPLALAALVSDAVSLVIHWVGGHRPGSEQALEIIAFAREHPSFWIVAGVAGASLVASLVRQSRGAPGGLPDRHP